ncbi:hypothetical protein FDA94_02550 [Herbidospora galbida]|uniref:IPT/TIG domain-containing protein n=2 Tax=Herbidospora galbida TaxID=2575442 RepID=A0A4U3MR49_9ACTN|nr:hypothetical protein FDA94_02550 [Herbidospora galbida]
MMNAVGHDGGPEPDKLWPWLRGVASNKVLEAYRQRPAPIDPPEEWADADYDRVDEARRLGEFLRLLDIVASGLTERQRRIYQLTVREGLRGQALADALATGRDEASRLNNEVRRVVADGFGAFVLADYTQFLWRAGRSGETCQGLLKIMREWNRQHGLWTAKTFPLTLRHQVSQHVRGCPACLGEHQRRVRPYVPGLIPVLLLPALVDRMAEEFAKVSAEQDTEQGAEQGWSERARRNVERDVTAPMPSPARPAQRPAPRRNGRRPRRAGPKVGNGLVAGLVLALLAGVGYVWAESGSPTDPPPGASQTIPAVLTSPTERTTDRPAPTRSPASPPGATPGASSLGNAAGPTPGTPPTVPAMTFSSGILAREEAYLATLTGFGANELIDITGDPSPTQTRARADANGAATIALTVGPSADAKEYLIIATGRQTKISATEAVTVIAPKLMVSAPEVAQGESATIEGTGFPYNTEITLRVSPGEVSLTAVTDCCAGTFTVPLPPLTTPGPYTIQAEGFTAQAEVSVRAPLCRLGLTMTHRIETSPPAPGFGGTEKRIDVLSATGLPAGATATFTREENGGRASIGTKVADQNGAAMIDTQVDTGVFHVSAPGCEDGTHDAGRGPIIR